MTRAALLVPLTYTAALAVWTLGKLALGETPQSTGMIAAGALLLTQCILSAIVTPWLACDAKPRIPTGLVPLVTTPWPLILLVIGISGISVIAMLASQIMVGALIVISYVGTRGLLNVLQEGQLRTTALTALQLAPAIMLWAGRTTWVPWFTG